MTKKSILVFMYSTRYSYLTLTKLEFSPQIFKKYLNTKCHENLPSGRPVVLCGWTDIHEKANGHFLQFWEHT